MKRRAVLAGGQPGIERSHYRQSASVGVRAGAVAARRETASIGPVGLGRAAGINNLEASERSTAIITSTTAMSRGCHLPADRPGAAECWRGAVS